jgi:hypothetical protein
MFNESLDAAIVKTKNLESILSLFGGNTMYKKASNFSRKNHKPCSLRNKNREKEENQIY